MTPERITQLFALANSASKGPWHHIKDGPMFMGTADSVQGPKIDVNGRVYRQYPTNYDPQVERDAAFIAEARSAVPELLAAVTELTTRVVTLKTLLAHVQECRADFPPSNCLLCTFVEDALR